MRRFLIALAGLTLIGSAGAAGPLAAVPAEECTDYCAEKAAERCERIDSWRCTWYIVGCLAGCGVSSL